MSTSKPTLGVLFVHGIGEQARGDTLLAFGEPLVEWLDMRAEQRAERRWDVRLHATVLSDGDGEGAATSDTPAYSEVTIERRHERSHWILAESFWARAFPPPTFLTVAAWVVRVAPWLVVHHVHDAAAPATSDQPNNRSRFARWWGPVPVRTRQLFILILGVAVSPVLQVVMLLLPLLAVFPGLRRVVRSLQLTIAGFLGDSHVLVESRIRFDAMVTRVRTDLHWLRARCDRVVVVAHSQGAAVAHEVLGDPRTDGVAAFVSVGAGIQKLHDLRHRKGTGAAQLAMLVRFVALAALLGVVWAWPDKVLMLALGGLAGVLILVSGWIDLPKTAEQQPAHALAPGIAWHDIYATLDPVPNGRLREVEGTAQPTSLAVHNQHSAFGDHTTYFANTDEVVTAIVRVLAAVSPDDAALADLAPDDSTFQHIARNRQARVRPRAYSRFIVWTPPLILLLAAHDWLLANLPIAWCLRWMTSILDIFDTALPQWSWLSSAIGVVMLFGAAIFWDAAIVGPMWSRWNTNQVRAALTDGPVHRRGDATFWFWCGLQLAPVLGLAVLAPFVCATPQSKVASCLLIVFLAGTFVAQLVTQRASITTGPSPIDT